MKLIKYPCWDNTKIYLKMDISRYHIFINLLVNIDNLFFIHVGTAILFGFLFFSAIKNQCIFCSIISRRSFSERENRKIESKNY